MSREHEEPQGTTLKVYWFMLRTGHPVRLSEMQKDLHLTTPSLAQYHIKKLVEMGLVQDTQEGYVVKKVVLKSFFRIRNTILPFQVFYAVFFGSSLVGLLLLLIVRRPEVVTSFDFVAIVVNVVALLASIYETRRTISNMP